MSALHPGPKCGSYSIRCRQGWNCDRATHEHWKLYAYVEIATLTSSLCNVACNVVCICASQIHEDTDNFLCVPYIVEFAAVCFRHEERATALQVAASPSEHAREALAQLSLQQHLWGCFAASAWLPQTGPWLQLEQPIQDGTCLVA